MAELDQTDVSDDIRIYTGQFWLSNECMVLEIMDMIFKKDRWNANTALKLHGLRCVSAQYYRFLLTPVTLVVPHNFHHLSPSVGCVAVLQYLAYMSHSVTHKT